MSLSRRVALCVLVQIPMVPLCAIAEAVSDRFHPGHFFGVIFITGVLSTYVFLKEDKP